MESSVASEQRFLVTVDIYDNELAAGIYVWAADRAAAIAKVQEVLRNGKYRAYIR